MKNTLDQLSMEIDGVTRNVRNAGTPIRTWNRRRYTYSIDQPGCHAGKDGDCIWPECPQEKDGEPATSGRSCPLWKGQTDD